MGYLNGFKIYQENSVELERVELIDRNTTQISGILHVQKVVTKVDLAPNPNINLLILNYRNSIE